MLFDLDVHDLQVIEEAMDQYLDQLGYIDNPEQLADNERRVLQKLQFSELLRALQLGEDEEADNTQSEMRQLRKYLSALNRRLKALESQHSLEARVAALEERLNGMVER